MTDYYKILGVEKNASKEAIKKAYEKQVEKIKKEVVNEKRLNEFLKLFDQAYEALNSLEESQLMDKNETLIIQPQEVQKELEVNNKSKNYISRNNSKSKGRNASTKRNDVSQKGVSKNKDKKNKLNDNKEEKARKQKAIEKSPKSNTKQIFDLLMLPFKILALPLIAILSVIILLCQIINVVSWIASKLLIIAAISVGAIHLYQVKTGQTINYNILILAASVLLASFFLPYILRFVLKVFEKLNNVLKDFVF
ncbi:J domain-containing protein [Clostridium uliginosum]|uniref:DnaJ domain-containing protein n=1 Tax=Clostridium uliginosum TaxID=119641 RepID=A0A1I1RPT6_9CLOT|nr:DnaJ domain-containing protein [Clostridium uliginosum]SFD36356.1 DnaJ domain-containing protein [Clostridium uliginosum]